MTETRVNTYTTGYQGGQRVTALDGGGWVVTWMSNSQDGSGSGVYQQAYDATGAAVGGEVRVNTFTSNNQESPQVAALAGGGWVVTWMSYGQDGSGYGVYQQAYDVTGAAVGGEVQVNTFTTYSQESPKVTALAGGGWVVTWQSDVQDGSSWGVYQQAYDATGTAFGGEAPVTTVWANSQVNPQITALAGGGWVVTWESLGQDGSDWGVYQQAYDATGVAVGGEVRVNTVTADSQFAQRVTALEGGGWVVTWTSDGQDGSGYGVYQQAYSDTGAAVGGEVRVNTYTTYYQWNQQVTALEGGGWVVTWQSDGQDGSNYGVYQQAYDVTGAAVGGEVRVNTVTSGYQSEQQVTALAGGGWVVTWVSGSGTSQQVYDATGTAVGAELRLNTSGTSGANPQITALADGGWVVTWMSYFQDGSEYGVYQTRFAAPQFGDEDDNTLNGSASGDLLIGLGGNDTLSAGNGVNYLSGGEGNDTLISGTTDRTDFDGGNGTDLLVLDRSAFGSALNFSIASGNGTLWDGSSFTSIERINFTGTAFNDTVTGGALSETLNGGGGNDTLNGGAGTNAINGDGGNDTIQMLDDGGVNAIDGGADSDLLIFNRAASSLHWTFDFRTPATLQTLVDGSTLVNVERANLTLGSGSDTVHLGANSQVRGGGGNDTLKATNVPSVQLYGEAGNDTLEIIGSSAGSGESGNILDGGADDDHLLSIAAAGPSATVSLLGGTGIDLATIDRSLSTRSISVDLGDPSLSTSLGDGTVMRDVERINLTTGSGNDQITGGVLDDTISGGAGRDLIDGGAGNDSILGGSGTDILDGGAGNDTLNGGEGVDIVDGGEGFDTANFAGAATAIVLDRGNSLGSRGIAYGDVYANIERFDLTGFNDVFRGIEESEEVHGGDGNDTLTGGAGGDKLYGDADDDVLSGGLGADTLDGGTGVDTVSYAASSAGVNVNLATGVVSGGDALGDVLASIENVIGSSAANVLTGNGVANKLSGGAGNDTLSGGAGADTLDGGSGIDTVSYASSVLGVNVNLATGAVSGGDAAGDVLIAIENIIGSNAANVLTGSTLANALSGGGGNDTIAGGLGSDTLSGGSGADAFIFNTALNSANVDTIADFSTVDTIRLENTGSGLFKALTTGTLSSAAFAKGAGFVSGKDTSDRIIYNTSTGDLYYDADGSAAGAAIKFATLVTKPSITNADFVVI